MSAPERFQAGDTVRCVNDELSRLTAGAEYAVTKVGAGHIKIDGDDRDWFEDRFVLVSRPTPPALDPFAWTDLAGHLMGNPGIEFDLRIKSAPFITAWVAWSRFCYWAAQSNLAAHFLPTEAAARTRASNGRDVPVATVLVELPVDDVAYCASEDWLYDPRYAGQDWRHEDRTFRLARACRRALGGGGAS